MVQVEYSTIVVKFFSKKNSNPIKSNPPIISLKREKEVNLIQEYPNSRNQNIKGTLVLCGKVKKNKSNSEVKKNPISLPSASTSGILKHPFNINSKWMYGKSSQHTR